MLSVKALNVIISIALPKTWLQGGDRFSQAKANLDQGCSAAWVG